MARALALGALVAVSSLLHPWPAAGEHEIYYRYVVLGYVKDARGAPVAQRNVELVRDKTGFSYLAPTDATGFFVLVARLGDESAGESLTLTVGPLRTRLTARFDPSNHDEDRGTRGDAEGDTVIERAAWFRPTLARFLGAR